MIRLSTNGAAPGRSLNLWCPACDDLHRITLDAPNSWTWDGNETAPTIGPSILVTGVQWAPDQHFYKPGHAAVPAGGQIRCHSFVIAGQWQFLADCTHTLAGQTVPLVPFPPEHVFSLGEPE